MHFIEALDGVMSISFRLSYNKITVVDVDSSILWGGLVSQVGWLDPRSAATSHCS